MNENDFLFCPRCGKKTVKLEDNLRFCHTCHLKNYLNPRPCNAVIFFNKDNEVLLIKRRIDPHKGKWDLPGGFVNPGESLEKSVEREIQEELDFVPKKYSYCASYIDTYVFEDVRYPTLCFIFSAFLDRKDHVHCADDAMSYEWFAKEDIPFGSLAFNGIKQALRDYFIQ